jgi:hypothetical protein
VQKEREENKKEDSKKFEKEMKMSEDHDISFSF